MTKFLLFLSLSIFSFQLFAYSPFDNLNEDACKDFYLENNENTLVCVDSDSADSVLNAKPDFSKNVDTGEVYLWDIVEIGIMPDDSTNHVYAYIHPLLNSSNKIVGYFQVIGARNSEWDGAGTKLINRYDLDGQLVECTVESI